MLLCLGQEAPKKKAKKLKFHDSKGYPHHVEPTSYANMGRKAAMLALGLEPKCILPYPNPEFKEEDEAAEEGNSAASEAAARQHTQTI